MKRRLFAFLLAALLCPAISGCSSPAGSSSQQTASQESTSSEQGENSEGTTITISYWGSTLEDDAMQKMCSAYKEQTGTTVERLYIPNADYTTKCPHSLRRETHRIWPMSFRLTCINGPIRDCSWKFMNCWNKIPIIPTRTLFPILSLNMSPENAADV